MLGVVALPGTRFSEQPSLQFNLEGAVMGLAIQSKAFSSQGVAARSSPASVRTFGQNLFVMQASMYCGEHESCYASARDEFLAKENPGIALGNPGIQAQIHRFGGPHS